MPYDFPIGVEVDIAEPRINKDRLTVTAGGRPERQAWDENVSDVWRDPLRGRVMLPPLPVTPEWRTTTSGDYARLAKASYTLTTSAAWVENHRGISGNIYLEGNGTNERVTTTTSYGADQPWFISVYVPTIESLGEQTILECGWGTYGGSTTISLRFRANGKVVVYEGGTQVGSAGLDYQSISNTIANKALGLQTVNILLLPVRQYDPDGNKLGGEIQIVTDAGSSLSMGFADLGTSDPIVPAGVFWWQVPIGRPSVQLAPVKFKSSGTLYGPVQKLRYAPAVGRSFTGRGFYSMIGTTATATYSVALENGGAYTADGTIDTVRGKVALANTSGVGSVCVEAVDWEMSRTVVDTDDSEKANITEAVEQLDFSVDDQGVTTCTIRARRSALVAAGMEGYLEASDRPFRVFLTNPDTSAEVDLIRGVLSAPEWLPESGTGNGDMDTLIYTGKDRSAELEYYTYGDTIADDGKLITDAIEDCLTGAGFDSGEIDMSISTTRVAIGDVPMGEWSLLPQRGDSKRTHLDKIFDTYAANWWRGWVPTLAGYTYRAHDPGDLSTTPAVTIYEDVADAIAAGLTAAQAEHRTIRSIVRHGIPPEANQVIVLGMSPYTGRVLLSQDNDTASQTPTTIPSSRPVTWRGRVHRVLELDPALKTQAAVDEVQGVLTDRLTAERYLIDWTSDFLVIASNGRPLWTGDVVRLYLDGAATYEDYRIVGMPRVDLLKMVTPASLAAGDLPFYVADYRGERIAEGP